MRPGESATHPDTCRDSAGRNTCACFLVGLVLVAAGVAADATQARPVRSLFEQRAERVVLQQWDVSCGAAALATVLRYGLGIRVTERQVAIGMMGRPEYLANPELVQMRQGFSLLDMKRFATRIGLEGEGLGQLTLDDLKMLAPVIVPVIMNGQSHYVVFRGTRADRVLLADPSFGTRTMTLTQFEHHWRESPEVGRVGFIVRRPAGEPSGPNLLAPRDEEFRTLG